MAKNSSHSVPVLVVGLGRFGSATALQLIQQGREVLGVERDAALAAFEKARDAQLRKGFRFDLFRPAPGY